jgi:hypothetical protein
MRRLRSDQADGCDRALPVGMNVFIINGLAKDTPMIGSFRGVLPFLIADFICMVLLIASRSSPWTWSVYWSRICKPCSPKSCFPSICTRNPLAWRRFTAILDSLNARR